MSRGARAADWFQANARAVGLAGAVVLLGGLGALAYRWNQSAKAQRAETALYQAQASAGASGDVRQVEGRLRDVATRYAGTPGGAQAQLLLAQSLYDAGRYQEGLGVLSRGTPSAEFADAVQLLTAAGREGLGQGREAAQIYERLASRPDLAARRRDELQAAAARAYVLGGDRASAVRLWREVLASGSGPLADEARVRIGELSAAQG